MTVDIGYIIHVELVGGQGDVILMSLSRGSPNLQLGSAAFYLFKSVRNLSFQWPIRSRNISVSHKPNED